MGHTHIGHEGIVRLLIENGADVNAVNIYRNSALNLAIVHGIIHTKNVKSFKKNFE